MTVRLQSLPAPDRLDVDLPPGHICLVSGDGTALTSALVRRLSDGGWPLVVLQPAITAHGSAPAADLPAGVPVVTLGEVDEDAVRDALAAVQARGPVGAVLVLHPPLGTGAAPDAEPGERAWDVAALRLPFLLAKFLQPALTGAAMLSPGARAGFVTVVRLDGALGTTARSAEDPVAAGVLGLTKALRLEWPEVFCRAVDLDPALAPEAAAGAVVSELFDPNRLLAEVAWGVDGRATLVVDAPVMGGAT